MTTIMERQREVAYTRCKSFSYPDSKYRPKVVLKKHRPKTVIEPEENVYYGLRAIVNVIFVFGAIASITDGVITALYLLRDGIKKEGNIIMRVPLHAIGIIPLCSIRIIVGIGLFWIFRTYTIGRRQFWTKWGTFRYVRRFTKHRSRLRQWWWDFRFYWLALEIIFAFFLTAVVVGNNARAYILLVH